MHPLAGTHQALLIGHVSKDLTPLGPRLGGTVSYIGLTLRSLGCRVRMVTSAGPDLNLADLQGIEVECLPADESTAFENRYGPQGRRQRMAGLAGRLQPGQIPEAWRQCDLLILGPIANEVDPGVAACVGHNLLGVTAQGWLRSTDARGDVMLSDWHILEQRLPPSAVVVLSAEDVQGDIGGAVHIAGWCRALALTTGSGGALVCWEGHSEHIPAPAADEIDPTGAGDIFAAVFFYRLMVGDNPPQAAAWANRIASASVGRPALQGVPTEAEIEAAGVREH
jgi:sugar/nucleoside kinase (ribokinase family)